MVGLGLCISDYSIVAPIGAYPPVPQVCCGTLGEYPFSRACTRGPVLQPVWLPRLLKSNEGCTALW